MCYEFSEWFTRARTSHRARQQEPKTETVKEAPQRVLQPEPAATETRVKERERAPA